MIIWKIFQKAPLLFDVNKYTKYKLAEKVKTLSKTRKALCRFWWFGNFLLANSFSQKVETLQILKSTFPMNSSLLAITVQELLI